MFILIFLCFFAAAPMPFVPPPMMPGPVPGLAGGAMIAGMPGPAGGAMLGPLPGPAGGAAMHHLIPGLAAGAMLGQKIQHLEVNNNIATKTVYYESGMLKSYEQKPAISFKTTYYRNK